MKIANLKALGILCYGMLFLMPLTAGSLSAPDDAKGAPYPEDFRRWVHVGTGVIMPGGPIPESEQGMHHIFANAKAMEGYSRADFAEGSVIVYELRQSEQQDGVIREGARRRVDVMIKDSRARNTGGWRFARFWGDDRTKDAVSDSGKACFGCHEKVSAHSFVFSRLKP